MPYGSGECQAETTLLCAGSLTRGAIPRGISPSRHLQVIARRNPARPAGADPVQNAPLQAHTRPHVPRCDRLGCVAPSPRAGIEARLPLGERRAATSLRNPTAISNHTRRRGRASLALRKATVGSAGVTPGSCSRQKTSCAGVGSIRTGSISYLLVMLRDILYNDSVDGFALGCASEDGDDCPRTGDVKTHDRPTPGPVVTAKEEQRG